MRLEVTDAEPGTGERQYMSVQLQLLEACNLKCTHCYNADPPPTRTPPTAEVERRIDAIYAFGRGKGFEPDLHLSGGEPTLRKDLVQIVRHIFEANDGDALLFTNGTRWTPELATELYGAGLRFVQVSLEGPEALTDAVRGQGVYGQATRTLALLGDAGFRRTVSITVTSDNFPVLFDFVEGLDELDLHFHLREVFPLGGGSNTGALTAKQRRSLSEWAVGHGGRSSVGLEDPVHCSVDPRYARGLGGCVAARNHFCVDVDGTVYPCRPLATPVGHIDDLEAAWSSPTMARIRQRDFGGKCGRCELLPHCGGCRVHALLDGDLFGEDRRCFVGESLVRTPFEARAIQLAARAGRAAWRVRSAWQTARERLRRSTVT
jgi:radical SAM protein with 4Fe4S-binding SPASM domain